MNHAEARAIALEHFYTSYYGRTFDLEGKAHEFEIVDQFTTKKSYGWTFTINTKKFVETGDLIHCLAGNGPVVVLISGEVFVLTAAVPAEQALTEFEAQHGFV